MLTAAQCGSPSKGKSTASSILHDGDATVLDLLLLTPFLPICLHIVADSTFEMVRFI
jgi:hypothetical protein